MTSVVTEDLRTRFYRLLPELLAEDQRAVAVFGEVGVGYLDEAAVARSPTACSTSGSGSSS